MVTREAMKAPPKKSVLDSGNLNVTKTADVANEILNEMQRNRGGDTVAGGRKPLSSRHSPPGLDRTPRIGPAKSSGRPRCFR